MFWTIVGAIVVAFLIIAASPIWIPLLGITAVASIPIIGAVLSFIIRVLSSAKLWAALISIALGGVAQLFFPTGFMIIAPSTYYFLRWIGKRSNAATQKSGPKIAPVV